MQDWLYDEGDDATRSVYVAKMDEIRFVAGPIVGRYLEKIEEERQAAQKLEEERTARKRADLEAKKKAEEEKKAADPGAREGSEGINNGAAANGVERGGEPQEVEMKDAEVLKADEIEEPEGAKN